MAMAWCWFSDFARLQEAFPKWDELTDEQKQKELYKIDGITLQACAHGSQSTAFSPGTQLVGIGNCAVSVSVQFLFQFDSMITNEHSKTQRM